MTKETSAFSKPSPVTPPAQTLEVDLSSEINAAVGKEVGETVKCVRVFGDNYRCNWWGSEASAPDRKQFPLGFGVTAMRVRKSSFLRATKTAEGLQIHDMTNGVPPPVRSK
jgi:hypothetical protein